ncbi:hypothetical protein ACGFNU_17200 [Spirillospora sp. NPDC048911]|uniref:hypothetical protein n=1 Tax=Spirillospora sp. NPDC048911 TaxID=3364527 RepID=UPI0037227EDF
MDEQTFPYDHDVLAAFPGARSYERGELETTYLAERGGVPYLIAVPRTGGGSVTVIAFEDERERAVHLAQPVTA